ncbi:MAG: cysteine desulfurase family protein [Actinomycetes bacterium]
MADPPEGTGVHPGLAGSVGYLDYNATTPVDPRVVTAMLPYLTTHFGNPSSAHSYAAAPRHGLDDARQQVAGLIGARPEEIVFTGSGSEADALAVRGAALAASGSGPRPHVITQTTEHPALLAACRALNRELGADITVLPVDRYGILDPAELEPAITPRTVLVSVMHANNETGTIQPIAELAAIARRRGALFHTDAAQTAGKIPVDVTALGVDLLTVVGHKMYAPKGVAALYVRAGVALSPLIGGGGQERGLRSGTESVAHAVALGAAAELAAGELALGSAARMVALRDHLHGVLVDQLPGRVQLNGHPTSRLPNTLNISIAGTLGHEVLAGCPSLAASTGSACHAGTHEPSPVLRAMNIDDMSALAAVRLSLGRWTTTADVETAAAALVSAAAAAD